MSGISCARTSTRTAPEQERYGEARIFGATRAETLHAVRIFLYFQSRQATGHPIFGASGLLSM
ncbi:MAG TPA: hypothetical protein VGD98_26030 [Ktedonobacteraceae bacterium]